MTRCPVYLCSAAVALAVSVPVHGEELARIATHSQRYGGQIGISAFDDPLLKGVTCYVSRTHDDNSFGGNAPATRASYAEVTCHQVGKISFPAQIPQQAQVFDESSDVIFRKLHVFRILDRTRLTVLYFSYTESELSGDMPGRVDVIPLPGPGKTRPGQ
jgi:CreA protein